MKNISHTYIIPFVTTLFVTMPCALVFAGAPSEDYFEQENLVQAAPVHASSVANPVTSPASTVTVAQPTHSVQRISSPPPTVVPTAHIVSTVDCPPVETSSVLAQHSAPVQTNTITHTTTPVVPVQAQSPAPTRISYPEPPRTLYHGDTIYIDEQRLEMTELKLQVRELASQLLDHYPGVALQGMIAFPTSFVNLSNFHETSDLGRYIPEALIYEFNLRGFPVAEYRLDGRISLNSHGEFALTRDINDVYYSDNEVVLVGTFLEEDNGIFVNARLVRSDGMVLRTAQILIPMNDMIADMSATPRLTSGGIPIIGY